MANIKSNTTPPPPLEPDSVYLGGSGFLGQRRSYLVDFDISHNVAKSSGKAIFVFAGTKARLAGFRGGVARLGIFCKSVTKKVYKALA